MSGRRWKVWIGVLAVSLLVACATGGARPSGGQISGDTYVNVDEGFGFRIPDGWAAVKKPSVPFAEQPPWVVRFVPAEGDASVTVYTEALSAAPCLDAANELLQRHEGAPVSRTEAFTVNTSGGEVPAWRGIVAGGALQGGASVFCTGGRVHVLAGVATPAAFSRYSERLERTIRSFAYASSPVLVTLAPPTPVPAYFVHAIEWRGQTLGQIAKWYTGAYDNWQKLTELNGLTKHAAPLRVGRRIQIPEELVTNRKPMPRPRPTAPAKPAATSAPAPTPVPTPPPVIGPRF